ncbi:right-handed parallel beta-helix repeat-containing protein, partial [Reichenbachiella sp.]
MTALLRKAALLFLILSSFYSQAQTNRYVNPTGSDASDCANPHTPCATIDYAMTQIVTGDIINLRAGLHASTTLNDGIYLIGEGDISIVQGITVSGDDITIENIKIEGGTTGITANGSNLTIKNVNCSGHSSRGIRVTSSAALTNLTISNCNLNDNNYGLWLDDDTDLDGLSVTNSSMDNGRIGFYSAYAASTNTGDVTNVTFRNCTFNNNTDKGIYVEKLDNALFENITVIGSGVRSDYVWNAGIDINLKWKAYSNITIRNARILDCGAIGSNNIGSSPENRRAAAITIKARTDASSYNSPAASLDNVTLEGVIINGLVNDIRFGEVDKVDNDGIDMSTVSISHCSFGNDDVYSFVNEENNGTLDLQYNYWGGATVSTADFSGANTTQSNDLANEIVDNANNSYATLSAALAGGNPTIRNLPSGTISGTTTISSAVTLISPGAGYLNDESRTTFENLTVNGGDLLMSSDIAISGDLALTNDLDIGNNFNIILDGTTSGSGAITADGTTGLIIEGNGDIASLITSADFERVSIDRPNGTVTLGADLSTEHLLLTNGLFNTSSTHEIIFTGLTALPGNDDSYVQGPMSASVTTTVIGNKVVFPVGKSEYHPIIFEGMDHTGAASLQAEFIEADPSGDGLLI